MSIKDIDKAGKEYSEHSLYSKKGFEHNKKVNASKSKALHKAKEGNPKGVMEKNNRTMMEIDRHNTSWNGKKYTK